MAVVVNAGLVTVALLIIAQEAVPQLTIVVAVTVTVVLPMLAS